jgi:hypothetical protein
MPNKKLSSPNSSWLTPLRPKSAQASSSYQLFPRTTGTYSRNPFQNTFLTGYTPHHELDKINTVVDVPNSVIEVAGRYETIPRPPDTPAVEDEGDLPFAPQIEKISKDNLQSLEIASKRAPEAILDESLSVSQTDQASGITSENISDLPTASATTVSKPARKRQPLTEEQKLNKIAKTTSFVVI